MLRLRPYKKQDSSELVKWFDDKHTFHMWCADKFTYPLDLNQLERYFNERDSDPYSWIMSALNENGEVVGHFFFRNADYEKASIHIGFVALSPKERGHGLGIQMLCLAAQYAFEILKVKKITLGVFEENPAAHKCYKAVGFEDINLSENAYNIEGKSYNVYDMALTYENFCKCF